MGVLLSCKVEQERPKSSEAKGGHDGIMDSSKFGVSKCFVEVVKMF